MGTVVGFAALFGFSGWVIGFLVVAGRMTEIDSEIAQGIGMMMAPFAPDAILFGIMGAFFGMLIGAIKNASSKKKVDSE